MCTCIPEIQYVDNIPQDISIQYTCTCMNSVDLLVIRKVGVHDLLYIFLV